MEQEEQNWYTEMESPDFYQQDPAKITRATQRLKEIKEELESSYIRWAELEELKEQLQ